MDLTAVVVAGSVLLHATVPLALELLCVISPPTATSGDTHPRADASCTKGKRVSPTVQSRLPRSAGQHDRFQRPTPCERYTDALPASCLQRGLRDSTRRGNSCNRRAAQDQCLGNRQTIEDHIDSPDNTLTREDFHQITWAREMAGCYQTLEENCRKCHCWVQGISNTNQQQSRLLHGSLNCHLKLLPTFERLRPPAACPRPKYQVLKATIFWALVRFLRNGILPASSCHFAREQPAMVKTSRLGAPGTASARVLCYCLYNMPRRWRGDAKGS